jgi:outer membrane biosynthesis protein TonB
MSDHDELDDDLEHDAALAALLRLDDQPGPARRIGAAQSDALVNGVLDAWAEAVPAAPAKRRRPPLLLAAAAAALLAVTGTVAALVALRESPAPPSPPSAPSPPPAPSPEPEPSSTIDPVEDSAPTPAPTPDAADEPRPAPRERRPSAPSTPASDLLAEANRLRRDGRFREAERTYVAASRASPSSLTSHAADVAAGSIRLEQLRDPRGAITLFRRALDAQPHGPLAVEAREGIARAHRRQGQAQAEAQALRAIVAQHPDTLAAERARTRLTELEAP